ncbi:MAG TPA: PEP-CTERM sorting domain-containing protein [Tepidisphaeraceae bacterium]
MQLFSERSFPAFIAVVLCAMLAAPAYAGIIDHSGSAQPNTTEGWDLATYYGASNAYPVTNDRGEDAWGVEKTSASSELVYAYNMSSAEIDQVQSLGWSVQVRLRVVDASDNPDYAVSVHFGVGSTRYDMAFGSSGNNPVVMLVSSFTGNGVNPSGTTYTVDDADGGYHDYRLVYDAIAGGADLYVDGVKRISNYAGMANAPGVANVFFGSAGNDGTGRANFNRVSVAVPEPASASILLLSAASLLRRNRRR